MIFSNFFMLFHLIIKLKTSQKDTKIKKSEFIFFRYFGGMELRFVSDMFPLFETIKFFFLGLLMAGSAALCGLGIAELIHPQAASTVPELHETAEQSIE